MILTSSILQTGTFAVVLWMVIRGFTKTKSYTHLIYTAWAYVFVWSLLNCILFPLLFHRVGFQNAFGFFPKGTGVIACGFGGWILGFQLAIIVWIVMKLPFGNHLLRRGVTAEPSSGENDGQASPDSSEL